MKLVVMADFQSSGIWDEFRNEDIDYDFLILSEQLQRDFINWILYYEQAFDDDYRLFKKGRDEHLNQKGMELAKRLKIETGNNVVYIGEDNNGLKDEVEI